MVFNKTITIKKKTNPENMIKIPFPLLCILFQILRYKFYMTQIIREFLEIYPQLAGQLHLKIFINILSDVFLHKHDLIFYYTYV